MLTPIKRIRLELGRLQFAVAAESGLTAPRLSRADVVRKERIMGPDYEDACRCQERKAYNPLVAVSRACSPTVIEGIGEPVAADRPDRFLFREFIDLGAFNEGVIQGRV